MSEIAPVDASFDSISYVVVTKEEGRVVQAGNCSPDLLSAFENEERYALENPYVNDLPTDFVYASNRDGILPRPLMSVEMDKTQIAADSVDKATISGLPDGATITVNGVVFTPGKPSETLTSDRPATYEILVSCWPYVNVTFTLDAD